MLPSPTTFEIRKRSQRVYKSLIAPSGTAACRGTAYIEDPANPGKAILADGSLPMAGFVTRAINVGGPTLGDSIYPNRTDLPFQDGNPISLEDGQEVAAEGYDPLNQSGNLYSGTGGNAGRTITGSTATGTKISFYNGQFSVALTGQYYEFYLAAIGTAAIPANTFRCRFVRIAGGVL